MPDAMQPTVMQAEHIPVAAGSSLHQQLHSWARHAAAVRTGSLQVAREACEHRTLLAVSPKLGQVAARCQDSGQVKVASLPAAGIRTGMQQLLRAEGQMLEPPVPQGVWHLEDLRCDLKAANWPMTLCWVQHADVSCMQPVQYQ